MNYLNTMTVKELRDVAKRMKLTGLSSCKKSELVSIIESHIVMEHGFANGMNDVYTCQLCKETVKVTDQASHMDGHPTEEEIYAQEETYTIEIEGTQPVILRGAAAVVMNAHEKAIKRWNPTMARDEWGMVKLTPKQRKRLRKGTHKRAKRAGLYV